MFKLLLLCAVGLVAAASGSRAQTAASQPLTVFAAASLTDAMKDLDPIWQAQGHPALKYNFAASSTLAHQIEQGAAVAVFASADEQWMDYLVKRNMIADGTRRTLLGNALVLVAPKDHPTPVTLAKGMNLAALLGKDGRIAVGDPSNVPAGIYAKQALTRLGLWDQVKDHLAPAADVRSALLLVEHGEAPYGIVYSTDAAVAPGLVVVGTFPEASHDPITYPFAVTRAGDTREARALLDFFAGPAAAKVFAKRGFTEPAS